MSEQTFHVLKTYKNYSIGVVIGGYSLGTFSAWPEGKEKSDVDAHYGFTSIQEVTDWIDKRIKIEEAVAKQKVSIPLWCRQGEDWKQITLVGINRLTGTAQLKDAQGKSVDVPPTYAHIFPLEVDSADLRKVTSELWELQTKIISALNTINRLSTDLPRAGHRGRVSVEQANDALERWKIKYNGIVTQWGRLLSEALERAKAVK